MVGIDIVYIPRIAKAIQSEAFKNRVFKPQECVYADGRDEPINSYAGMFCAKEAVSKALKRGLGRGIMPTDIEIGHEASGAPIVIPHGDLKQYLSGYTCDLSISHDGDYAIAIAELIENGEQRRKGE